METDAKEKRIIVNRLSFIRMFLLGFFVLVFSVLSLRIMAAGNTYYVSPEGNDANPGTLALPFKTIQKAADLVNPGDEVIVRDGVYSESPSFPGYILAYLTRGGTASAPVTFRAENKWGAVLSGNNQSTDYGIAIAEGASYINIYDFEIVGFLSCGIDANNSFKPASNYITIKGNKIHDIGRIVDGQDFGRDGIYFSHGQHHWTIDSNLFYNIGRIGPGDYQMNKDHAIYTGSCDSECRAKSFPIHDTKIINNIMFNVSGQAITSGSNNDLIANNIFAWTNANANGLAMNYLYTDAGVTGLTLANNIFYQPPASYYSSAIQNEGPTSGWTVKNNIVYGGKMWTINDANNAGAMKGDNYCQTDCENGEVNPLFVSANRSSAPNVDFRLQSAQSGAVDKGADLSDYFTEDYLGNSRPKGNDYDIGPYESNYSSVQTPPTQTSYQLILNKGGTGFGTVTGSGSYSSGTVVTATATPNTGSTFDSWTGDCNSSGQVTMTANKNCIAVFNLSNPTSYTLNITAQNGTVAKSPNTTSFAPGTTVTLTATPNSGYTFTSWSGDVNSTTNPISGIIDSNKNITANFTAVVAAGPKTYYVATTGNDANSGTLALPFKTIQKATDIVNPGDTVIVRDGTYTTSADYMMLLQRSGSSNNPITFKAENNGKAILDGGGQSRVAFGLYLDVSYINISGFEIKNFNWGGFDLSSEYSRPNKNITISDNYVHDIGRVCSTNVDEVSYGRTGAFIFGGKNIIFERNTFRKIGRLSPAEGCNVAAPYTAYYQNHDHPLYIDGVDGMIVRNNIFIENQRGWGVHIYGDGYTSNNISVVNNTFAYGNPYRNGGHIVLWGNLTNSQIQNNIFYNQVNAGIEVSPDYNYSRVTISNNISYGGQGEITTASDPGITVENNNLINTDPKLVNPSNFDFHLQSTSPAINAGLSLTNVRDDYLGNSRPSGGGYDIGAYEYQGTVTPPPPPITYTLGVTANNGSVTKSPNKTTYASGEQVTLTASSNPGYQFLNWSGNVSGASPTVTVVMNANKNITANFTAIVPTTYTININPPINGTITKAPNKTSYSPGESITLTAIANTGYRFKNWTGDFSSTTNPLAGQINSNISVGALFEIIPLPTYTLTTQATNGSITKSPSNASYPEGSVVTLTANPNAGYRFKNWTGSITSSTNPTSVTMDANKSITTNFEIIPLPTVNVTSTNTSIGYGATTTISWTSTNSTSCSSSATSATGTSGSFTTPSLTSNKTYTVSCSGPGGTASDSINIVVASAPSGTLTSSTSSCLITSGASSCTIPFSWSTQNPTGTSVITKTGSQAILATSNSGTNVAMSVPHGSFTFYLYHAGSELATKTVTASCTSGTAWNGSSCALPPPNTYTLTVITNGGTVIKNPEKNVYTDGDSVTLTAVENSGYTFRDWTGSITSTNKTISLLMTSNKTVTANFSANPTGSLSSATSSCLIAAGASTCSIPFSWNTQNPTGTSVITKTGSQAILATSNTGTNVPLAVLHGSFTFYLYHAGSELATKTVTASCASGTAFEGGLCKIIPINYYTIEVTTTNGTVTKNPNASSYKEGSVVSLTANPDAGYQFKNWTGDITGANQSIEVTVNRNLKINANFAVKEVASGGKSNGATPLKQTTDNPLATKSAALPVVSAPAEPESLITQLVINPLNDLFNGKQEPSVTSTETPQAVEKPKKSGGIGNFFANIISPGTKPDDNNVDILPTRNKQADDELISRTVKETEDLLSKKSESTSGIIGQTIDGVFDFFEKIIKAIEKLIDQIVTFVGELRK